MKATVFHLESLVAAQHCRVGDDLEVGARIMPTPPRVRDRRQYLDVARPPPFSYLSPLPGSNLDVNDPFGPTLRKWMTQVSGGHIKPRKLLALKV